MLGVNGVNVFWKGVENLVRERERKSVLYLGGFGLKYVGVYEKGEKGVGCS